jgi:hypothetical protein
MGQARLAVMLLVASAWLAGLSACKSQESGGAERQKFHGTPRLPQPPAPRPTPTPEKKNGEDDEDDEERKMRVVDKGTIEVGVKMTTLTITGVRKDLFSSGDIVIKDGEGVAQHVPWPDAGQTVSIQQACPQTGDEPIRLSVEAGGHYVPSNPQCFIGTQGMDGRIIMGFEADCDSTSYHGIDDMIAAFSCSGRSADAGPLTIEGLRIDPSIDVPDWIN